MLNKKTISKIDLFLTLLEGARLNSFQGHLNGNEDCHLEEERK